jgi:hypothetical protein
LSAADQPLRSVSACRRLSQTCNRPAVAIGVHLHAARSDLCRPTAAIGVHLQAARTIVSQNRYFARFRRYYELEWAEIAALHDFFDKTADFERKSPLYAAIYHYM